MKSHADLAIFPETWYMYNTCTKFITEVPPSADCAAGIPASCLVADPGGPPWESCSVTATTLNHACSSNKLP